MTKLKRGALCVCLAMMMALTAFVPVAYAQKYDGLQVTKVYEGRYDMRAQNWIEPYGSFMGIATNATAWTYEVPKGKLKLKAQVANQSYKILKSGSWTANSQIISYTNPSTAYFSYTHNGVKVCSYGQMAFASSTALTGVTQVPASPLKS